MTHSPTSDDTIATRLDAVHQRIAQAARAHDRNPDAIALVAVSKTQPVAMLEAALAAGHRDFGENYLQDALTKIDALAAHDPVWHFIGDIQSNKTRDIATHFAWAHAVNRLKIARRLSEQRPEHMPPLNTCIQVNIDQEASKSGIAPGDTAGLADQIAELPNLRLRGLMALPAPADTQADQRKPFARLRELFEYLNRNGHALDTLSMGMSTDLEAAIAEGATRVRVGTAIFGARQQTTAD